MELKLKRVLYSWIYTRGESMEVTVTFVYLSVRRQRLELGLSLHQFDGAVETLEVLHCLLFYLN